MSIDKRKLIPRPAFLSQLEELLSSLEEDWHVVSVVAGQRRFHACSHRRVCVEGVLLCLGSFKLRESREYALRAQL
jgi:hypothetical protein